MSRFSKILMASAAALALAACGGDSTADLQSPGNTGSNPGTGGPGGGGGGGGGGSTGPCPSHPNIESVEVGTETHCRISGTLTEGVTLTTGPVYQLSGAVFVGEDVGFDGTGGTSATLNIQAGVRMYGADQNAQLTISRGSIINANGTASQPIIMSSANALGYGDDVLPAADRRNPVAPGDADPFSNEWGGVNINGRATLNECPATGNCEAQTEGNAGLYGGTDDADSSGTLRYVRIEYAGFPITGTNELNAIAFWGVGSGTTVDYLQTHNGGDDGIEMFGGTVNMKHLVITGADDDSLDWTFGWRGMAQFIIIAHNPLSAASDSGYEADNNGNNNEALPRSMPTISNVTLVGDPAVSNSGILLRAGTAARLYNHVIGEGWTQGLDIDGPSSYAQQAAGNIVLESFFNGNAVPFASDADDAGLAAFFAAGDNNTTGSSTLSPFTAGGIAYINGVNENGVDAADVAALDPFFDAVTYTGAVRDAASNWTLNWTRWLND